MTYFLLQIYFLFESRRKAGCGIGYYRSQLRVMDFRLRLSGYQIIAEDDFSIVDRTFARGYCASSRGGPDDLYPFQKV